MCAVIASRSSAALSRSLGAGDTDQFDEIPQWTALADGQGFDRGARDWFAAALGEVVRLVKRDAWLECASDPPSEEVVKASIFLLLDLARAELPQPLIGPVSGGGLQVEWRLGVRELEIEVRPDGSLEFLTADGEDEVDEGILPNDSESIEGLVAWLLDG